MKGCCAKRNTSFEKFSSKGEKRERAEAVGSEIEGGILFGLSF